MTPRLAAGSLTAIPGMTSFDQMDLDFGVMRDLKLSEEEREHLRLLFLAVEEASKKWTSRHRDWAMIYSQLLIFFGDPLGGASLNGKTEGEVS